MKKTSLLFAIALTLPLILMSIASPATSIGVSTLDNKVSEIGQKAFSQIGECLRKQDAQLNALFVLDASSSLPEDTDKDGVRGDILAQSVAQLVSVSESRPVNIAISSFDLVYRERVPWEPLNAESFENINQDIPSWVSTWWGEGGGTNWEAALSGGAETMRDAPNTNQACKIIIWLTDGGINVDGPREIAPNKLAMENICGTNPVNGDPAIGDVGLVNDSVVAQLRSENVHLIGVLLESEDYLTELAKSEPGEVAAEKSRFSYMLPVTEGTGIVNNSAFVTSGAKNFEYTCGNIPIPAGQALGALLSGSSPIALGFAFSDLDNGIRGGVREDLGTNFPVNFDIEPGINSLSVQLAGSNWSLTGPDERVVQYGDLNLESVSISQEGSLANIRIVGDALPEGQWTLNVDGSLASAVIYRGIEVDGMLDISPTLQAGETSEVVVEFRDSFTNEIVPVGLYSTGTLDVSFTEGQAPVQDLVCVQDANILKFVCRVEPQQVGEARLSASFLLKTKSESFKHTYLGTFVQDVLPSAAFPSISPTSMQLSEIPGNVGRANGTVRLNGPTKGSGEVCLPSAADLVVISDVIDRRDSFTLEWSGVSGNCVPLQQGETVEAQLSIGTSVAASGQASVSLPFILKSTDSANELKQDLLATFTTVREGTPNPFVFLGLIVLGFGIPIALLYLQARSASKLSLKGLQVANVPVRLTTAGDVVRLTRATPEISELFKLNDWQWFSSSVDKTRSFTTPSGAKLIAKTPKNPLGSLSALAIAPEGSRVITSEGFATDGLSGRIGLSPVNQWILTVPSSQLMSDREDFDGQLVAFANPNGGALEEVNHELTVSAQDGMLLGALLTVRNNMLAQPAKGKAVKEKGTKKFNGLDSGPSSPATQNPHQSEDPIQTSPFDALFGGADNAGGVGSQENTNFPSPSSPTPPPKTPGSEANNPFENL